MHGISGARSCRCSSERAFEMTAGAEHTVSTLQNQRAYGAIVAGHG
jgi:hypothetical protein